MNNRSEHKNMRERHDYERLKNMSLPQKEIIKFLNDKFDISPSDIKEILNGKK